MWYKSQPLDKICGIILTVKKIFFYLLFRNRPEVPSPVASKDTFATTQKENYCRILQQIAVLPKKFGIVVYHNKTAKGGTTTNKTALGGRCQMATTPKIRGVYLPHSFAISPPQNKKYLVGYL